MNNINEDELRQGDVNVEEQVQEQEQEKKVSKTFTQEELEKILADRLERERRKYKDYEELKQAAEELKKIKESQMSREELLQQKMAELEKQLFEKELEAQEAQIEKTKVKVAMEMGLPADALDFISGTTEEEIRDAAMKFKKILGANTKVGQATAPTTSQSGARIWTRSEIESMSKEEIVKYRDEIQQAMKEGRILDK